MLTNQQRCTCTSQARVLTSQAREFRRPVRPDDDDQITGKGFNLQMDRVKRIWYLSQKRAAKVQASLRIRAVSPEPSLLTHTSSESRGTSDRKPDPWPLWMAGHAQLKFVMTECSMTQIRLTGLKWLSAVFKYGHFGIFKRIPLIKRNKKSCFRICLELNIFFSQLIESYYLRMRKNTWCIIAFLLHFYWNFLYLQYVTVT